MSLHSNFIHKIVGNILKKIGKNDLQQSLLLLFANRFTVTEDDYNPTIEMTFLLEEKIRKPRLLKTLSHAPTFPPQLTFKYIRER